MLQCQYIIVRQLHYIRMSLYYARITTPCYDIFTYPNITIYYVIMYGNVITLC